MAHAVGRSRWAQRPYESTPHLHAGMESRHLRACNSNGGRHRSDSVAGEPGAGRSRIVGLVARGPQLVGSGLPVLTEPRYVRISPLYDRLRLHNHGTPSPLLEILGTHTVAVGAPRRRIRRAGRAIRRPCPAGLRRGSTCSCARKPSACPGPVRQPRFPFARSLRSAAFPPLIASQGGHGNKRRIFTSGFARSHRTVWLSESRATRETVARQPRGYRRRPAPLCTCLRLTARPLIERRVADGGRRSAFFLQRKGLPSVCLFGYIGFKRTLTNPSHRNGGPSAGSVRDSSRPAGGWRGT